MKKRPLSCAESKSPLRRVAWRQDWLKDGCILVMPLEENNMVKKVIVKIISAKDKLKEKEQETEEVDDKLLIPMCAWACKLQSP